jgi:hypothetical protein
MHYVYFESLHLEENDPITIVDHSGNIMVGYYKGNYKRREFCFDFENASTKTPSEISLKRIQILHKVKKDPRTY